MTVCMKAESGTSLTEGLSSAVEYASKAPSHASKAASANSLSASLSISNAPCSEIMSINNACVLMLLPY